MLYLKNISVVKKKLILGFKYIRFKSFKRDVSGDTRDVLNIRTKKLAEILDCSQGTAKLMILKNKTILTIPWEDVERNAKFCKKYLKWGDIIDFPLISTNSGLLQHRYFSLLELGFANVSAREIFRYQHLLKMTPKQLRRQNINIWRAHSLEYFDIHPQIYEFMKNNEVSSKLQKMYENDCNLGIIKETMNVEFLQAKLKSYKASLLLSRYPPLRSQSIFITTCLLEVLSKNYKFPAPKIFQVPSILSLHHEIAMLLLQKSPKILGVEITEIAYKYPLLLRHLPEKVKQIDAILKYFNISDQQLLCCPRIVSFTPRTLKKRLQYLCNSEDFSLLKSHKKFLWLVHHENNLIPRLQALKAIDKPYSISTFMFSQTTFANYLIGTKGRTHVKDVCHYLAKLFNSTEHEIHTKLQEFPGLQNSSVRNSNDVVEYLLDAGVSKKQLFNGLGVILYDVDVVKLYFEEMQTHSAYQPFTEWIAHYNLIQLLIYAIEVDCGWRGSRAYAPRTKSIYSDELVASGYCC